MVTNTNLIYTRLGSDSHADISCAGSDARILNFLDGRTCTVHPYNDSYKPKMEIKLCDVAFIYDTDDGRTYILRLNQCLDFRNEMKNSLFSTEARKLRNAVGRSDSCECLPKTKKTHVCLC